MTIVVRDLEKWFGKNKVVDRVSFDIQAGELVALLGPSGGGKSTVLRIIAGLETPDGGDVLLNGELAPASACRTGPSGSCSSTTPCSGT
jgi:sulfate transport system ATP-binding protein